jgi:hypothetical protein
MPQDEYWNHNVHYQPVILDAVPDGCGAALEVGCADGMLARRLAERATPTRAPPGTMTGPASWSAAHPAM